MADPSSIQGTENPEKKPERKPLSPKHAEFLNWFLQLWNQTEAYKRAYPNSSHEAARRNASRLMANDDIQAELKQRMDEQAMSSEEVLARVSQRATSDLTDFVRFDDNGNPVHDLKAAAAAGKLRHVKKIKIKTNIYTIVGGSKQSPSIITKLLELAGTPKDGEAAPRQSEVGDDGAEQSADAGKIEDDAEEPLRIQLTETAVEFELYDGQRAEEMIMRRHGLFKDKLDVSHTVKPDITADERAEAQRELDEWRNRNRQKPSATQ